MIKRNTLLRLLSGLAIGLVAFNPTNTALGEERVKIVKSQTFDNDFFIAGEQVDINHDLRQDLYATGGEIHVNAPVHGDVFAIGGKIQTIGPIGGDAVMFGGEISIDSDISGDGLLIGGRLNLNQRINGSVRAAGGRVDVGGVIDGNALIAGGRINVDSGAHIVGKATLAGGVLRIDGKIGDGLRAVARRIIISGEIVGNANLRANEIVIEETARFGGDLVYYKSEPIDIPDSVSIGGDLAFIQSEEIKEGNAGIFAAAGASHLVWLAGLILTAAVIAFASPAMLPSMGNCIRETSWRSIGIGFATLIGVPLAIVLLAATVLGIPLALTLAAAYGVTLMIGYVAAAYVVGRIILFKLKRQPGSTLKWQIKSASVGLLVLGLVIIIPVIGVLINVLALAAGMGSILLALAARRRSA